MIYFDLFSIYLRCVGRVINQPLLSIKYTYIGELSLRSFTCTGMSIELVRLSVAAS